MQLVGEWRKELELLHKLLLLSPGHLCWELEECLVIVEGVNSLPAARAQGSSAAVCLPLHPCLLVCMEERLGSLIFFFQVCAAFHNSTVLGTTCSALVPVFE